MRGEKGKIGGVGLEEEEEEVLVIGEGGLRALIFGEGGWDGFFLCCNGGIFFFKAFGQGRGGNDDIYIRVE